MIKNPPANEGDMGFDSSSRKIPHARKQLSPCTIATEPVLQSLGTATPEPMCCNHGSPCTLEPLPRNERRHCSGDPAHHKQE